MAPGPDPGPEEAAPAGKAPAGKEPAGRFWAPAAAAAARAAKWEFRAARDAKLGAPAGPKPLPLFPGDSADPSGTWPGTAPEGFGLPEEEALELLLFSLESFKGGNPNVGRPRADSKMPELGLSCEPGLLLFLQSPSGDSPSGFTLVGVGVGEGVCGRKSAGPSVVDGVPAPSCFTDIFGNLFLKLLNKVVSQVVGLYNHLFAQGVSVTLAMISINTYFIETFEGAFTHPRPQMYPYLNE